jgi:predicted tellurium resistance membrane protein TerC
MRRNLNQYLRYSKERFRDMLYKEFSKNNEKGESSPFIACVRQIAMTDLVTEKPVMLFFKKRYLWRVVCF